MFENIFINMRTSTSGMGAWYNNTRKLNQSLSNINKDANRTATGIARLGGSFKGLNQAIGIGKIMLLGNAIANSVQSAIDMVETVNLFSVALGDTAVATNEFVDNMHDAFGLDQTNLQNAVGTFALLARSMGMSTNQSSTLSTNVAKLATDLSSLTNVPIQQVMADLKSGLVGQSETVYKYGMDVTEAGLKQEALRAGITKSVRDMSQGEKMALRYSAMIHQSGLAQGDFAKTINTPANQLRILGERFVTLGRAIGQLFIPILSATLPYLNAFVALATDVANAIAKLFGITTPKVSNSFGSALGGISDGAEDATDSVKGTTKAMKELKNTTFGMDELNVVEKAPPSSSGGSGGIGGGMSTLPDFELPTYDNLMSGVSSMADEIKQRLIDAFNVFSDNGALFDPLINAFFKLQKAVEPVMKTIGSIVSYVFKEILVPFAQWTISDALPSFFNLMSGALKVLNPIFVAFRDIAIFVWENFLKPIAVWTGKVFIDAMNGIGDALTRIGDWMSNNQGVITTITTIVGAFFSAWGGLELLSFLGQVGGVTGGVKTLTEALKGCTLGKLADMKETLALKLMYAKDFLKSIADLTVELGKNAVQFGKNTLLKIADKTETLKLAGMYAVDFVKGLASATTEMIKQGGLWIKNTALKVADTVAQGAMTIALLLWNTTVSIATGLTSAFGAVVAFLTSPIGLVVLAIGAMIAVGVLLYQNWETVCDIGTNVFGAVFNFITTKFSSTINNMKSFIASVTTIFNGLVNFITGIFTGNWSKAWSGVVDIFKGIFGTIANAVKAPLNFIIDAINTVISGLNRLSVTIPDWVPLIGGKSWNVNIPKIPHLAKGGMLTDGTLFEAGENGRAEAIGSHNGKTTVMPLENTDFVSAMYEAVYNAVSSAQSNNGGQVIENILTLDGDVIYKNQQKVASTKGINFGMGVFSR